MATFVVLTVGYLPSISIASTAARSIMVPEAANTPPMPWLTKILAPEICAGAVSRYYGPPRRAA